MNENGSQSQSQAEAATAERVLLGAFVAFDDCKRRNSTEFMLKKKRAQALAPGSSSVDCAQQRRQRRR